VLDREGRPFYPKPSDFMLTQWRAQSKEHLESWVAQLRAMAKCTTNEHSRVCWVGEAEAIERVIEEKRLEEIEGAKD
jgi:hypothetical protein